MHAKNILEHKVGVILKANVTSSLCFKEIASLDETDYFEHFIYNFIFLLT